MRRIRRDILRIQARKLRLVRRQLHHPPKEASLWIGRVRRNVQRALARLQPLDNVQARLVDGALWLLGVFERDADLVAQLGPLVALEVLLGLGKIVLEEVEEGVVVGFRHARVVEEEGAVGDEGGGGAGAFSLDEGRGRRVVEVDVQVDDGEVHRELGLLRFGCHDGWWWC